MNFDLVTGGFPCQQFSEANPSGAGLEGTESVFWAVLKIVRVVCENPDARFLLECTDFKTRHPADFARVSEELGVAAKVLQAGDIAACYRRRAYWANFPIHDLVRVEINPNSVLEEGCTTWW